MVAALWDRVDAMVTLIELGADCEKTTYGGEAASLWGILEGEASDTKILGNAKGMGIGAAARAALMRREIAAILRAVLRAGSYELEHRMDIPARVVVSEYVDVAHAFVENDEAGMVNAVLDQIARHFRTAEFTR